MRSPEQARKWVVISALVVAGIWGYRRWREAPSAGATPAGLMKFPEFVTAWGAVYFGLAMVAEAAPRLAGSFAVLVMVADVLQNAHPGQKTGLLADFGAQQAGKTNPATPPTPASTTTAPPNTVH